MTRKCRRTDKLSYPSKRRATEVIRRMQGQRAGDAETLVAFKCEHRGLHWHIGHPGTPSDKTNGTVDFTPEEWDQATLLLWARCRDRCEACGQPLGGRMERHHRQRRAVGGDRLSNLVALHPQPGCHADVHAHPEKSRERGLIVSSYAPDPALVPLVLPDGTAWLLDDEGGRTRANP